MAALDNIGFREVCLTGMVTGKTIISERGPLKEEAGTVQGVAFRPDKRREVALRGSYLNFFPFMDKFRFWQDIDARAWVPIFFCDGAEKN
jgi:hypothetical protein